MFTAEWVADLWRYAIAHRIPAATFRGLPVLWTLEDRSGVEGTLAPPDGKRFPDFF